MDSGGLANHRFLGHSGLQRELSVGPFENPLDGAMGIFSSREAADEFVSGDPFMLNGVVARATIRGWRELYGG